VELASELSGSTVAAIVVCTLIAFLILVVAIIILVVLMRKRRQRQKEEAAAKQTPVGPSTKPVQPTHNGTWSGSFHGLWKDQTWRGTPEEDELPLSDRADGVRSVLCVHHVTVKRNSLFTPPTRTRQGCLVLSVLAM